MAGSTPGDGTAGKWRGFRVTPSGYSSVMSLLNKAVPRTKEIIREAGDSLLPVVAEGAAQATEMAAGATRRTADAARDWADDVQGVTARRRLSAGLGLLVFFGALFLYFGGSNGRKKTMKKFPQPMRQIIERAS